MIKMASDIMKKFLRYEQLKKYAEGTKTYIDSENSILDSKLSQAILDEKNARELTDSELQKLVEEVESQLEAEIESRSGDDKAIVESIQRLSNLLSEKENALISADETIKEDFTSNLKDVKSGLESQIEEEISAREDAIQKLESTVTESIKLDNTTLVRDEDGNISLNPSYLTYLNKALYEENKPAITTFNFVGNIKTSEEIGKSVVVNGFEHKESNLNNIDGILTLRKGAKDGTIIVDDIAKSSSIANIAWTETVNKNTTYYLTMSTIKPELIYAEKSIRFYAPAFIVTATTNSISQNQIVGTDNTNILNRQRLTSSSLKGSKEATLSSNGYIYFATTETINKMVDPDTGFGFGYTSMGRMTLNINGENIGYNVYRSEYLTPGTYKITIS